MDIPFFAAGWLNMDGPPTLAGFRGRVLAGIASLLGA